MKIENFVVDCNTKLARGNVLVMDKSCYLWIGSMDEQPTMECLVSAMETKFGVLSSDVLGFGDSEKSQSLAQKLSRKFKIQTFVSYALPEAFDDERLAIESKIVDVLKVHFGSQ